MKKLVLVSLMLLSTAIGFSQATPEYYNSFTTSVVNNYPLGSATNNKAQWIYPPHTFYSGGTGVGTQAYTGNISKIYLKLGNSVTFNNYANFTISLSQNVGTATSFGTTAASAYSFTGGMTQSYFQATGYNLTGGTANQWFPITLNTSFPYNPNLSLVVEIKVSGGSGNNISLMNTALPCRLYGGFGSTVATTATGVANLGLKMIPTPLPALVTSFKGHKENSVDVLNWSTSSELNNSYFNLQHSTDGINFTNIERVVSKADQGNSNQPLSYQAINMSPAVGKNYYRLEQVDIDGAASFNSDVVEITHDVENGQMTIFPNPATSTVNVNLEMTKAASIVINVVDMNGRVVKQERQTTNMGLNSYPLNIQQLSSGIYSIAIMSNDKQLFAQTFRKN